MNIGDMTVLVTGASGGIGSAIARDLAAHGAALLLSARQSAGLDVLCAEIVAAGGRAEALAADITNARDRARLVAAAQRFDGGIDVLVNNAGRNSFGLYEDQGDHDIEQMIVTNSVAPMLLTKALLPQLRAQPRAAIVNVGSILGSLALPGQTAYAASKAALRVFNDGLRRELAGSGIAVVYLAPRATDTGMNGAALRELNTRLGVRMDSPAEVAAQLRTALLRRARQRYLGWPEKAFVRINALLPALVDRAVRKNLALIENTKRAGDSLALETGGEQ